MVRSFHKEKYLKKRIHFKQKILLCKCYTNSVCESQIFQIFGYHHNEKSLHFCKYSFKLNKIRIVFIWLKNLVFAGFFFDDTITYYCSKTSSSGSGSWPSGNYCIMQYGSSCPSGTWSRCSWWPFLSHHRDPRWWITLIYWWSSYLKVKGTLLFMLSLLLDRRVTKGY